MFLVILSVPPGANKLSVYIHNLQICARHRYIQLEYDFKYKKDIFPWIKGHLGAISTVISVFFYAVISG